MPPPTRMATLANNPQKRATTRTKSAGKANTPASAESPAQRKPVGRKATASQPITARRNAPDWSGSVAPARLAETPASAAPSGVAARLARQPQQPAAPVVPEGYTLPTGGALVKAPAKLPFFK